MVDQFLLPLNLIMLDLGIVKSMKQIYCSKSCMSMICFIFMNLKMIRVIIILTSFMMTLPHINLQ